MRALALALLAVLLVALAAFHVRVGAQVPTDALTAQSPVDA